MADPALSYVTPLGVSVTANAQAAANYAASHTPAESLRWFYNQVRDGGPWDYKQFSPNYENFGNFNYGVAGTATTQSGELFSLNDLYIASINVASTANSQVLPDGNQVADFGMQVDIVTLTGIPALTTADFTIV